MSNTSFQELNLSNAFLFPAALEDPETCRLVIECIIGEVPKILVDFLGYLNDSTDMYVEQDLDEKVKRIHERIKILKQNRNVEKNYMHYLSVEKIIKAKEMEAEDAKRNAEEAIKIVKDIVLETVEKLDMLSEDISERIKMRRM